jgi:hypothetical protein
LPSTLAALRTTSSFVDRPSATAIGPSLTGVIVSETVAGADWPPSVSVTRYVKLSPPA